MSSPRRITQILRGKKPPRPRSISEMASRAARKRK